MTSAELNKLKDTIEAALGLSLTKHDWAKALAISIASLHRYLDESESKDVPPEVARLMQALLLVIRASPVEPKAIVEAIKTTGVAGVVARAASAGLLPAGTVALLASTPALVWFGALGGAVGAMVGAGALAFFQKVQATPTSPTTKNPKS